MQGEQGWEEPLVKMSKSYCNGVASLYMLMRNLMIITTSSKEIPDNINSFENFQNWEISRQSKRSRGEAGASVRGLEEMEHTCLTNVIANSQLRKPFIEPIWTGALIWMIVVEFSWIF